MSDRVVEVGREREGRFSCGFGGSSLAWGVDGEGVVNLDAIALIAMAISRCCQLHPTSSASRTEV